MRRLLLALMLFALPAFSQWRTGYFLQGEAGGQTAATIPWSKYTHVVHYAVQPTYSNGVCGLAPGEDITEFVSGAHASNVKAILGIVEDDTREAITACTTPQNIPQFVDMIHDFAANHQYDGVDIDWENGILAPQYQDFIRRLRTAMPTASLSVAVGIAERFLTAAVQTDLDQINIRVYAQDQAMDSLIWHFVYAGNASSKLGLAVPFYSRIRRGCLDPSGTMGVTDPNQVDSIPYRDLGDSTYSQYKQGGCLTDAFISYPGPEQLQEVVALIEANQLGGIATYGLPYEYSPTQEGDARYPLSTAIYDAMVVAADAPVMSPRAETSSSILGRGGSRTNRTAPVRTKRRSPSIVTSSPLLSAVTGAAYSQTLVAAGTTPITWAVTSGALPAGLSLGSSGGIISGRPTSAGVSKLTVRASNAAGSSYKQLSLTVNAATTTPSIVTTSPLPSALTGAAYSQALAATGTTPITWAVTSGTLPAGLSLGSSTGILSGTPMAAGVFALTVSATNAVGSNSKQFSLTVNAAATVAVSLSPASVTLTQSQTRSFSATVTNTGNTAVTWALSPALGSITATGLYSAPASITSSQTTAVKATSVADPTKSATATVTLTPPVTVSLTPSSVSLLPSQNRTFTATVSGTSNTAVTWSINPALGSLVSGATTAVYVAPSTAQTTHSVTITATSMASPSKAATAVITLLQAITVSLSPSTVSLAPSGTQQFAATVSGASNTAVTWSINPSVGTISSAGLYTAPSSILTSQTVTVTAQSVADPTKSAGALVSLSTPVTSFTYYVDSANGSDSNPGNQAAPWKTIAKVNSTNLTPGQSVGFARGGMWRETLNIWRASGTAGSPITFGAYGSGANPILDGTSLVTGWSAYSPRIYQSSVAWTPNVVFQDGVPLKTATSLASTTAGSSYYNSSTSTLYVWTTGSDNPSGHTIEATKVPAEYFGLIELYNVSYITIQDLAINRANWMGITAGASTGASTSHIVIQNNTFQYNYSNDINFRPPDGSVTYANLAINYNTFTNSGLGRSRGEYECVAVSLGGTSNSIVHGNVVTNQGGEGLQTTGNVNGMEISNNTVDGAIWGIYVSAGYSGGGEVQNVTVKNNLVKNVSIHSYGIGSETSGSNIDTVKFYYNVSMNPANACLVLGNAVSGTTYTNLLVANNTCYGGLFGLIASGPTTDAGNTFENNIYSASISAWVLNDASNANYSPDYELLYGPTNVINWNGTAYTLSGFLAAKGKLLHGVSADPLFTNPSIGDFTLQSGSPAINAGACISGVTPCPTNIGAK